MRNLTICFSFLVASLLVTSANAGTEVRIYTDRVTYTSYPISVESKEELQEHLTSHCVQGQVQGGFDAKGGTPRKSPFSDPFNISDVAWEYFTYPKGTGFIIANDYDPDRNCRR